LLGVLVAVASFEVTAKPELSWSSPSWLLGVASMPTLLFRRSRPFWMVAIAFGGMALMHAVSLATGRALTTLDTSAYMLLHPYALFRWGKGPELVAGLPIILLSALLGLGAEHAPVGDMIGGLAVLSLAMALGAAVRFRHRARQRELEQVKLQEREQLARDLHDTVAHHVSAIAVRAQAGLVASATRPESAVDALRVIEGEASRALTEMRLMVRVLRNGEPPELAPEPRIADVEQLAQATVEGPDVAVELSGNFDDVAPSVAAAVYRLAQESITNARRHAWHATRIEVGIKADPAWVELCVSDDGDLDRARRAARAGYGLLGMIERAKLLGGTCRAGPNPVRGWTVTAVLPRNGPAANTTVP
jgi:signal transduction histidine kinase